MRATWLKPSRWICALLLAAGLGCAAAPARAQRGGGGGPGGGGGMGHGSGMQPGGGPDRSDFPPPGARPSGSDGNQSTMEGGLHLGPPGRWWNDKQFAKSIGLNSNQQHRMDGIFGSNKDTLIALYKSLKREESELGKATRARELDEKQIDQQIDRVVQARGELEKANAHMLLELRKELTADQVARLDDYRLAPQE